MTDQELDSMMKRVLLDALKVEWEEKIDALPALQLSARRQRSTREMLADPLGWARKRARPVWKKALQRVAAVLIVCSLTLGSLMAISPTVRAAVIRWVTEWYETHVVYRYSGDQISTEMPQYEITELPTGYIESERINQPGFSSVTYDNTDGDIIYLDCISVQDGYALAFSTENADMFPVKIAGFDGQLFSAQTKGTSSTVTWINSDNNLQFTVDGLLSDIDILRIAESVRQIK